MVERDLPKVEAPVRFWYPAPGRCGLMVKQHFRKVKSDGSIPSTGSKKCLIDLGLNHAPNVVRSNLDHRLQGEIMCLSVSGKITNIEKDGTTVLIGGKERKCQNNLAKRLKKGDYVLVSGGIIIQKIDEAKHNEIQDILRSITK